MDELKRDALRFKYVRQINKKLSFIVLIVIAYVGIDIWNVVGVAMDWQHVPEKARITVEAVMDEATTTEEEDGLQ